MRPLLPTLLDHDPGMLKIIAHRWDVDLPGTSPAEDAQALAEAMCEPERAAREWARLSDAERGALQTLLGAQRHRMPEVHFARLFGEIRRIGPGRREREKPHVNPANVAETLYYRGLIACGFDQAKAGMQPVVYVPTDLADVLPVHATGFDLTQAPEQHVVPAWQQGEEFEPEQTIPATSAAVDDLTTLLAYLQIARVATDSGPVLETVGAALEPFWLVPRPPAAVALLIALAGSLGLVSSEGGTLRPVAARARPWLDDTRPRQVRALAEAWRSSALYNELWHTPGLLPEDTGWRNDPLLARDTVLSTLRLAPPADWWPADDLIALVKAQEPDFQRPGGDYESWYIRDAETGEYLHGLDQWDRVEGALLRFILTGPLHWLGLVDLGDDGELCRLTPYGRALVGEADWPNPAEDRPHLIIDEDGTLRAPRMLSRYERFQIARFTEWGPPGDPYLYRLTAPGLRRAAEQELTIDMIQGFLRRSSGRDTLPRSVQGLLTQWAEVGHAEAWLTQAVVLRVSRAELLQTILDTPELRRYLGAQLGPAAVLVRPGQEHDLTSALHQHGIAVDLDD